MAYIIKCNILTYAKLQTPFKNLEYNNIIEINTFIDIVIRSVEYHIYIIAFKLPQNWKAFHMSFFEIFRSAHSTPPKGNTCQKSNNKPPADRPVKQPKELLPEEMARLSITRVPVDYYHYGAFRYTSLKDAIAEAKRARQI